MTEEQLGGGIGDVAEHSDTKKDARLEKPYSREALAGQFNHLVRIAVKGYETEEVDPDKFFEVYRDDGLRVTGYDVGDISPGKRTELLAFALGADLSIDFFGDLLIVSHPGVSIEGVDSQNIHTRDHFLNEFNNAAGEPHTPLVTTDGTSVNGYNLGVVKSSARLQLAVNAVAAGLQIKGSDEIIAVAEKREHIVQRKNT